MGEVSRPRAAVVVGANMRLPSNGDYEVLDEAGIASCSVDGLFLSPCRVENVSIVGVSSTIVVCFR